MISVQNLCTFISTIVIIQAYFKAILSNPIFKVIVQSNERLFVRIETYILLKNIELLIALFNIWPMGWLLILYLHANIQNDIALSIKYLE